jgi:hypothetical protein
MAPVVLGLINIAINAALLVLVGLVVIWILSWLQIQVPDKVQKIYMVIVALIVLYQVAALIFGLPVVGVVR